jgi:hypothetical protein
MLPNLSLIPAFLLSSLTDSELIGFAFNVESRRTRSGVIASVPGLMASRLNLISSYSLLNSARQRFRYASQIIEQDLHVAQSRPII